LVLNLQVLQIATVSELVPKLGALWPKLLSYALSFVLVGIYWVAHHNTFHYIKRSDRNLLWLSILLLMCIVFLPFPTALLGQYPEQQISIIIYAGTLVITGLVLQALWWYATSGCRLVDRNIDPRLVKGGCMMSSYCRKGKRRIISMVSCPYSPLEMADL